MKPTYTAKADVFSFAMTCYEVVSGKLPYNSLPRQNINKLVREGVRPELPKDINTRLSSLIQKCWQTEAPERPTFEEICFDLQEMKTLETQEMKALETQGRQKFQKRKKSRCTIS